MRTLVYGLGESGVAATRALTERGERVLVADGGDDERLRDTLAALDVSGVLGAGPEVLEGIDRIIASPGISPRNPVLRAAEARGIPILSEVGLGLELLGDERARGGRYGHQRKDHRHRYAPPHAPGCRCAARRRGQLLENPYGVP